MARFTIKRFLHDALVAAWGSQFPRASEKSLLEISRDNKGRWRLMLREEGDLEDECNTTARVWFRDANPHTRTPSLPDYPIRIFFFSYCLCSRKQHGCPPRSHIFFPL